ncbi:MAG: AsnC family transcriptional regulator [Nanoarchaeota archaeon]
MPGDSSEGAIVMGPSRRRINLDKIDRTVIQILVEDARTPLSRIASRVNLSKAGVLKRIDRLVESKVIIDFIPITNPLAWGYNLYFILFSTDAATEDEDIHVVRRCPYVWWFVRFSGRFNFQLAIVAKDSASFYKIWGGLAKKMNVRGEL